MAAEWPGLEGMDLAKEVSRDQLEAWSGGKWELGQGYLMGGDERRGPHVVAIDYGAKRNIFRNLVEAGARVTVLPATASFDEAMSHKPDGFFLSNGPGDPAATGEYAIPVIRQMLETGKPLFGICLGHQLLALAVGGRTAKMFQGHRGANHPVKRLADGAVEITSMNHGFAVEREGLPEQCPRNPCQPVRRQQLRDRTDRPPGLQRPISSGSKPRPAGQLLSVRAVRGPDEGGVMHAIAARPPGAVPAGGAVAAQEIVKVPAKDAPSVARPDDLFRLPPGQWHFAKQVCTGNEPCDDKTVRGRLHQR